MRHRGQSRSSLSIAQQRFMSQSMAAMSLEQAMIYYVGVDVGTGSARACIIDNTGNILSLAEKPIQREELKPNYITQSSQEIWQSICHCVKSVVRDSGVPVERIHGIGFDATCSLVVVDDEDKEVGVGPVFANNDQNIVLWMDHRAIAETNEINATNDKCLKYVGGQMSVEMEIPKIKWLKNNLPKEQFEKCKFFDLADYLTFKATNKDTRSFCSTVCKQGLIPIGVEGSKEGWSKDFLNAIDLPELVENDFAKIGGPATATAADGTTHSFLSAGEYVGALDEEAAEELGLPVHCVVGSGVIDAYAGWVGTVAAQTDVELPDLAEADRTKKGIDRATGRLAAVAGTSTCHIALSRDPVFVNGVWGPYRDVMAHGFWAAEGGQSCTGALLAHVMSTHPAFTELSHLSDAANISKFDYLNSRLETLVQQRGDRSVVALAKHLYFYGDYHGNRSPIADPSMRAAIIGQSMDNSIDDLAIMYLGACEFIAQQTRQIVEKMCDAGHQISTIFMSGGQCRNGLLMRLLADCTGLPIIIPRYIDAAVVFGSALLGAVASESFNAHHAKSEITRRRKSSLTNLDPSSLPSASGKGPLSQLNKMKPDLPSPYTAPHATSSTSQIAATSGSFPFPVVGEPSEAITEEANDSEGPVSFKPTRATSQEGLATRNPPNNGDALWDVMYQMTGGGKVVRPSPEDDPDRVLLNAKYKIFLDMADSQRRYREAIDKVEKAIAK